MHTRIIQGIAMSLKFNRAIGSRLKQIIFYSRIVTEKMEVLRFWCDLTRARAHGEHRSLTMRFKLSDMNVSDSTGDFVNDLA